MTITVEQIRNTARFGQSLRPETLLALADRIEELEREFAEARAENLTLRNAAITATERIKSAERRAAESEVNDRRWRKAREIFSIEDIERADREMRETGSIATEEENVKADAAIDAALASEAGKEG